ncbi:4-hydroxy-tetrahydrodipicolinate synthase [Flaviaesturariibacter flavus]|uniref:4-hydroxy-tetrahydrodipicolinate synthase n=1 Tax=Flaviaesturariibacter flavus TaxID=2502780 RepID=A0A4R1B7M3_9BACT|nr:4-hydroxy-tetrahydrodipicolinate synthase [Flaviaesturariibacter flavus]TCJ12578.1 4-hydroxy-tetrahydrodipicolinate synthase [Flaviaesturariibacter flavus]
MVKDLLQGTGVALVTPFDKNGVLDLKSLERLINFVIEGGVDYVVSLGTTGETPVLSREEKLEVLQCTFSTVEARVPVVIGAGGNNTASVIKEIEALPVEKAAAILSASPYYNKPSQEGIYQHYKAIAAATPRPIILYNVPGRTGSNIAAETTVRLAGDFENINGIKEASGNMNQCMQILRDVSPDFMVVSGDDNLAMAQIACGMSGVISVAANCFPKDFSTMISSALEGNFTEARSINTRLLRGYDLLFAENNPAGVKAFLAEMGVIANYLRLPLVPLSEGVHNQVRAYLQQLHQSGLHA